MEILFVVLLCVFSVVTFFMPWFHRSAIRVLRSEVETLNQRMERLELGRSEAKPSPSPSPWTERAEASPLRPDAPLPQSARPEPVKPAPIEIDFHDAYDLPSVPPVAARPGFEIQFGAKLSVWAGGIALALAGFYFVKYSIDVGLLSPGVRIMLGTAFGIGMLFAGNIVRNRPGFSNGERIAQALSGAGIADLYACIFAASSLYHLIPSVAGFAGMAAVTAAAVILSLRHGAPIAMLGLIGGFLTPAMIGSEQPSAPILFGYLYLVLTGLMVVIRHRGWWKMGMVGVAAAFLWVLFWLAGDQMAVGDALCLSLFLLAVWGTVAFFTGAASKEEGERPASRLPLNTGAGIGVLLLMAITTGQAGFSTLQWGLFGLMAAGCMTMAYFNQKIYAPLSLMSLTVNGVMLLIWHPADPMEYALVISAFAALYVLGGYFLQWRSREPLLWALQTAAAATGFSLLAYFRLHHTYEVLAEMHLWAAGAFILAALSVRTVIKVMREMQGDPKQQHLLAVYAAVATAFIALHMAVEFDREILSVAIAAEVLALAWINTRVDIAALRRITGVAAAVVGVLLVPQMIALFGLSFWSLFEVRLHGLGDMPVVKWPVFQLGLPALFFAGASIFLCRKMDGRLVRVLEVAAIALAGLAGYYLSRHIMHPGENILFVVPGFTERGVITNIVFLFGLACTLVGREFARKAVAASGLALCLIAVFRIGYFDFMLHNPLWSSDQSVGGTPVFNALLLTYGLPALWVSLLAKKLPQMNRPRWVGPCSGFMLLSGFTLVSFEVRQFYHGAILGTGLTTNAEIYTYSAAWLLSGLCLLFFGTLRKDRMTRLASLVIVVLAVGKVFLYDASALQGLYRVFSFFGLGLTLLGLSWFYTRFILVKAKEIKGE
ncbi:MAG: DUF2339 domain-containing protein [Pseudomonadota bacterium]